LSSFSCPPHRAFFSSLFLRTAAEEVKARGAEVIIITDNAKLADGLDPAPLVIPRNGPLTAVTAVLPLQLIAYVFFPIACFVSLVTCVVNFDCT